MVMHRVVELAKTTNWTNPAGVVPATAAMVGWWIAGSYASVAGLRTRRSAAAMARGREGWDVRRGGEGMG